MRCVTSFADEIGLFKKFKRTQSIADKLNLNRQILQKEMLLKDTNRK